MADKKTVDKVKELLSGHVYAPLKEAAEKWLSDNSIKFDKRPIDVEKPTEKELKE